MRSILLAALCLFFSYELCALEYEKQFENDQICVARVKIMPEEEIGLHYDIYPQIVIALQGGIITRFEADGSTTQVQFPTGKAIFRPAEMPEKLHKSANKQSEPIELIIVQLK